jgi:predicted Ser/Thr protein kinase
MSHPISKLCRADIEKNVVRVIHQGKGLQSSVYLVEVGGQLAAVKDFAGTPPRFREFMAPLMVCREVDVLRLLDGTPGVPRCFGRVDRYAFAMEFIEGTPIADFPAGVLAPEVLDKVRAVIDAIHARGVSHGDLKRRSNVLVTPDGRVYLIDFAAALVGNRRLNFFVNWLQKRMAEVDNRALLKMKKFAMPDLMTEDNWDRLNTPTTLERWVKKILNR